MRHSKKYKLITGVKEITTKSCMPKIDRAKARRMMKLMKEMGENVDEDHIKKLSLWGDFRSKFSYNRVKRDYNLYYNPRVLWNLQKTAA